MDKMWDIYPFNGILSDNKKWSTRCYNMEEHWKHCVKQKKPDTKGHILLVHWYALSSIGKSVETERRWIVARGCGKGITGSDCY